MLITNSHHWGTLQCYWSNFHIHSSERMISPPSLLVSIKLMRSWDIHYRQLRESRAFSIYSSYSLSVNLAEFLFLCPLHNEKVTYLSVLMFTCWVTYSQDWRTHTPIGHIPHTLCYGSNASTQFPSTAKIFESSRDATYHSTTHLGKNKHPSSPD